MKKTKIVEMLLKAGAKPEARAYKKLQSLKMNILKIYLPGQKENYEANYKKNSNHIFSYL